jgi:hypothetical protein
VIIGQTKGSGIMAKFLIILGAIVFFFGGSFTVALIVLWLQLPTYLAVIGGMIVGAATLPLTVEAWDKWVR